MKNLSMKQITEARYKIIENKLNEIKCKCAELKNSSISKTDALKVIQNICNRKDENEKMWKDLLEE